MSHLMTALAMRQTGIKPAAKIILYWLADHHNGETGQCNPSINRLAKCCEMSRRSVENNLQSLQEAGLIKIINRFREQGGKTSNIYTLCMVESDTQNLRMGCAKSAHGDTQNLRMKNLGTLNLGNEPKDISTIDGLSFNDFWAVVPKMVEKADAKKVWEKAVKKTPPSEIMAGMVRYAATRKGQDQQYTVNPATWLRRERWNDVLDAPHAQRGNTFFDKVRQQMKGTENETGLFNTNADDTKRIN